MRRVTIVILGMIALAGCATGAPLRGLLYTNVSSGLGATENQFGNRVGEACATGYLGLVALGDATIDTARRNGGISVITSVDASSKSILFFYEKHCTIVRGR